MKMSTQDWRDYSEYLRGQVKDQDLSKPRTIADAYNNFEVMQDLDNVVTVKLGIKTKDARAKA